eukprot:1507254-Prymnesium_polylepis.1
MREGRASPHAGMGVGCFITDTDTIVRLQIAAVAGVVLVRRPNRTRTLPSSRAPPRSRGTRQPGQGAAAHLTLGALGPGAAYE